MRDVRLKGKIWHYGIQCQNKPDSAKYKSSYRTGHGDDKRTGYEGGDTPSNGEEKRTGHCERGFKRRVNMIEDGRMVISREYNKFVQFQDCMSYGISMIRTVGRPVYGHGGPRIKLVTEGREVSYLIETGSDVSCVVRRHVHYASSQ